MAPISSPYLETEQIAVESKEPDPNNTAKHQRVVFCPADNAIYPRCTFHMYYRNSSNRADFMDFDVLKESLYRTLRICMPLALATDMKQTSFVHGGLTANLSSSPPYPLVTRHVDEEHTIAEMVANGFSLESQPPSIVNSVAIANPLAGDALVSIDVAYMTDGVGLSMAFSHAIADLASMVMIGREWGNLARAMLSDSHSQHEVQVFDIDRTSFWDKASSYSPGKLSLGTTQHLEARWTEEQQRIDNAGGTNKSKNDPGCNKLPMHRLRISADSVEKLKEQRPADCRGISVGALIAAVLWQSHTQAHPDQPYTYCGSSITIRADPQFAEFCGNTSTIDYTYNTPGHINTLDIYAVARIVQQRIRDFTVGDFVHYVETYSTPAFVANPLAYVAKNHEATIVTVNASRLPFYDIDFGYGRPCKFVCPVSMVSNHFCFMLPQEPHGGIEIYARVPVETIERVRRAEFLLGHVVVERYE
ncbi:hypothetical protein GGI11_000011 [Coemansia sp. RSA 2049]|nr:hypothetical protein GGI11_000011 [Coemansia sp. RSA 2049]